MRASARAVELGLLLAAAGCAGPSQPSVVPNNAPGAVASWMSGDAKRQPSLLYVSDLGTSQVTVYNYNDGRGLLQVGKLKGFSVPTGMCTDKAGNVWIADYGTGKVTEYAHGGTTPIAKVVERGGSRPYDCTVDLATGTLAVANQGNQNGNVEVYANGSRKGTEYAPPLAAQLEFLAFDNRGNLFVDGTPVSGSGNALFFKLSKGGGLLTQLSVSGGTIYSAGGLQWINPTLLIGDRNFQDKGLQGAYKVFPHGTGLTVVDSMSFPGTQDTYAFWRRGNRIVVPDHLGNVVNIYDFSGGSLFATLKTGISLPFGTVISQAE